jgi:hypothetical protein
MRNVRLIDADLLKKNCKCSGKFEDNFQCVPLSTLSKVIDNQPTAYDADKVVKQLEENRWIPVAKGLPEELETVLVWFEYYRYGNFNCMYQTYGLGYVVGGKFSGIINGTSGWKKLKVIAWMPLPRPYEEGK